MDMGDRIKYLREKANLTQEELGDKVGVKKAAVNKWESGITKNLKRTTIKKLSELFEVTPSYLMGWDDLKKAVYNSEQETKFSDTLELIDCSIEYKSWLIPPKDFELDENQYYTITYDGFNFNITIDEYKELVKDIKSYLRFKILDLSEISNKRRKETSSAYNQLLPNAAHEIEGASDEDKAHDDALMDDDNF